MSQKMDIVLGEKMMLYMKGGHSGTLLPVEGGGVCIKAEWNEQGWCGC